MGLLLLFTHRFDLSYTICYTYFMKTAISLNNEIFNEAEQTAQNLGLSRSKLYSLAIKEFIQNHNPDLITAKLNQVYSLNNSKLEDDIDQLNYDILSQEEW